MKSLSILIYVAFTSTFLSMVNADTSSQRLGWPSYVKPGDCPIPDGAAACTATENPCTSDCECPNQEKCCYQEGCGNSCVFPANTPVIDPMPTCNDGTGISSPKPGSCPAPDPNMVCIWCFDQCTSDCQCKGQQKCCSQPGCGYSCKDVV